MACVCEAQFRLCVLELLVSIFSRTLIVFSMSFFASSKNFATGLFPVKTFVHRKVEIKNYKFTNMRLWMPRVWFKK